MPRRCYAYAVYGLLVAAALAVAFGNPLLFQKLNTLRPADGIPDLATAPGETLDIDALVRPIPLHGGSVFDVLPETRYRRTIVEGGGNCTQMVFGLAHRLERDGIDYQIIHMLTPEGIRIGDGHTVVRLAYRHGSVEQVGLVDVSFGAILTGANGGLDVEDVEDAPVEGWGYVALNEAARFPDYHDDFLVDAVLGYIPPSEVRSYYAFLERVYFPIGHELVEKYFFDGLALGLGVLPEVQVPKYDELMTGHETDLILHRGALTVLRSLGLVAPLLLGFELFRLRRR